MNNITFSGKTELLPQPKKPKLLTGTKNPLLPHQKTETLPFNSIDTISEVKTYLTSLVNISWVRESIGFAIGIYDGEKFNFDETRKTVSVYDQASGQFKGDYTFDNFFDLVRQGKYFDLEEKDKKTEKSYSEVIADVSRELHFALEHGNAAQDNEGNIIVFLGKEEVVIPNSQIEEINKQMQAEKEQVKTEVQTKSQSLLKEIQESGNIFAAMNSIKTETNAKRSLLGRYLAALKKANKGIEI